MRRVICIFLLTHLTLTGSVSSQVAEATPVSTRAELPSVSTRKVNNTEDLPANTRNKNYAKVQYGTASFYADKFEGKKTASGEAFTQKGMTAAHNSLPMGTWIRVTNLSNKRSVVVRVNDRLHHRNPRLVDLSKSAAKKLGYTGKGLSKVRVDVLGKSPNNITEG